MLMRRQAGIGLVELMIAVVILGIMTAIAVPGMTTWIKNARIRTVADALQSGLRLAQTEAQRRSNTVVFFRTTSANCQLGDTAAVAGQFWQVRAVPSTLLAGAAPQVVQCGVLTDVSTGVVLNSTATAICFGADGRQVSVANPDGIGVNCTAAATTFNVVPATSYTENRPLSLTVSMAGALRMCDPSKATTAPDGCRS